MLALAITLLVASAPGNTADDEAEEDVLSVEESETETPPIDARQQAAKLIAEGNALLDAGRAAEALKRFSEAHDTLPTPTIFLSMAEAYLKLGNSVRAAEYYQRFLEEKGDSAPAKLIMLAEQRLEELAAELATVKVQTTVEGALVSIDEDPIGETPMPPVFLKPGLYRITVAKEGHVTYSAPADLAGGETRVIDAKLEAIPVAPPVAVAPPKPQLVAPIVAPRSGDEDGSILGEWWFWAAVGGAVATGVTVGLVAGVSGGDDFVPGGELGSSGTSSWQKL